MGHRLKRFSLSLVALSLSACMTVGPDYRAPEDKTPVFSASQGIPVSDAPVERAWWQQFHDPVLNQLVSRAQENNHDIRIAMANFRAARAIFDDRDNDRFPVVASSAGYQRSKAQQPGVSETRHDIESYRAGFDMSWEVDLFGRVARSIEAARADADAANANLRAVQISIIAEVARTYGELRGNQVRLSVLQKNRDNQKQTLVITRSKRDAGIGTDLDVASASARLAATEAAIPPLRAGIERAKNRLAVLTGFRPGELPLTLSEGELPELSQPIAIGKPEALLRRRPDVQRVERELAGATARVGIATADLFPRLSVTGFLGFLTGNGASLGDSATRAYSVAPSLSWPAFDLGSVRARLRAADADADAALARYQQTVLNALEETEDAFVDYGQQQQRLAYLKAQAAASRHATELARDRYQEGAVDFLVLLDAEREQLAAEDAVASARTSSYTSLVAIYKALGGGWETPDTEVAEQSRPPAFSL